MLLDRIDSLAPTTWLFDAVPANPSAEGVQPGDYLFDGNLFIVANDHSLIQIGGASNGGVSRFVSPSGSNSNTGLSASNALLTVQAAVDAASPGDVIKIATGTYDEAVVIDKSDITIMGLGGFGDASITPSASNAVAVTVDGTAARVASVKLVNIDMAGNGTGGGLLIKGDIRMPRVIACKAEGGAFAIKLSSDGSGNSVADIIIQNCEIAWTDIGIHIVSANGADALTELLVKGCWFHDCVTSCITNNGITNVQGIWVTDGMFANAEDGTPPTKYLDLAVASSTGMFSKNTFATATNAATVLTIATGIMWVANATEAGWSTARPA